MQVSTLVLVPLLAASGAGFGYGYFAALRYWVALQIARAPVVQVLFWAVARLAAALAFFVFAARWGALPLMAALLGFLAARSLAVRAAKGRA